MTYPDIHPPRLNCIPNELKSRPQWVDWRLETRSGEDKPTKIPYTPRTGDKAKAGQPSTWDSFAEAVSAYEASQAWANPYSGIGFELAEDDGLFGGDLDACIDPDTGEVADWASEIIRAANTYTEQSPSGTGLRFFGLGTLPEGRRKAGPLELYDKGRFLTITGRRFGDAPVSVADCSAILPTLHAKMFPPKPEAPKPSQSRSVVPLSASDSDILTIANKAANGAKFAALWRGDTSAYSGDDSAADLALVRLLAFYTGDDPSRIASLFGQSELGQREKWNRADYRERTISAALSGMTDFYSPPGVPVSGNLSKSNPKTVSGSESTAQPGDEWDLPVPFGSGHLPAFPLEALPSPLAEYVAEVAASTQVPLDMAAMLGLSVVAAACARRAQVRIGDTHTEPLSLYIAAVMEPGSRKSSTLEAFAEPLREAEQQMSAEKAGSYLTAKEKREQETKRLAYLRDKAARENNDVERKVMEDEATYLAANLTEVQELPRLLADDITMEKLAGLLSEQEDNSIAILSAEGGVFGILAGRYTGGALNLDLVLKGHSGETHRVDRVNQPPRYIKRPTITMGLAVQPDVLNSLADNPSFRGRGLLGRFLYTLPENLVGSREYINRPVDPKAKACYADAIHTLLRLPTPTTRDDPGARHTLRLNGAALALWKQFYDDVERRQADGQDLSSVRDWASKLAGAVARIAGNLHLMENFREAVPWNRPITAETVAAAWSIGEYLIPHGLAAFGQMGADAAHALARRILKWIERSGPATFSARDCFRVHQNTATMEEMTAALTILSDHGCIRLEEQERSGPGRKPSPLYAVNPALKKQSQK